MSGKRNAVLAVLMLPALPAALAENPPTASESCVTILGSDVCTWAVTEGGTVTEVGATIPMELIEAVPADAEMVWPPQPLGTVPMPESARSTLGIDHLALNWEAHGHPPTSFMTQHFDFHFYSVTRAEVAAIDCSDETKPSVLPDRYALPDIEVPGMGVLVGLCVPQMGMHAMPESDVEAVDAFGASMMMGYYAAGPVFFEPMVSRELLKERSDFVLDMPRVGDLPPGVHYPSAFRAEYDSDADAYRFVFRAFYGPRS